jgi:DNA-binding CsgD family transcriptional regulator
MFDIKTTNKNALEYSLKATRPIESSCHFFTDPLGLTTFGYKRIYDTGRYLFISTNQDWLTYHYQTIRDHGTFFKKAMDLAYFNQSYITSWPYKPEDHFLEALNHFGMWYGINFYKRYENYIELFTFSTSENRPNITSLYLNTIPYFEKFIKYFKLKNREILNIHDVSNLAFIDHTFPTTLVAPHETVILRDITKKIEPQSLLIEQGNNIIPLTVRESDCIKLLRKGITIKEIASFLELSPRTVETYINNVKEKTGCNNKSTLLKLVQENRPSAKGFFVL